MYPVSSTVNISKVKTHFATPLSCGVCAVPEACMPKLIPGGEKRLLNACCMLKAGTGFPGLAGGNQVLGSKMFVLLGADVEAGPA